MNSDALLANAWNSQDEAAQELERTIKLARRFTDRKSLAAVENSAQAYIKRLNSYLDQKERDNASYYVH